MKKIIVILFLFPLFIKAANVSADESQEQGKSEITHAHSSFCLEVLSNISFWPKKGMVSQLNQQILNFFVKIRPVINENLAWGAGAQIISPNGIIKGPMQYGILRQILSDGSVLIEDEHGATKRVTLAMKPFFDDTGRYFTDGSRFQVVLAYPNFRFKYGRPWITVSQDFIEMNKFIEFRNDSTGEIYEGKVIDYKKDYYIQLYTPAGTTPVLGLKDLRWSIRVY
jgi:hypothetical protein